jgi:hypothetical protein
MEFLGPLLAMGLFSEMNKSSESGESMDEDELKSFQEFVERNIIIESNKYCCKICGKKFSAKDAVVKHIGNTHEEQSDES